MGCDVGDGAEIELSQHALRLAAILERRCLQALRDQRLRRPEAVEHVEGGRMKGRGARFFTEIASGFEHGHRHAATHEIGGGGEADRTRAGDQYALFNGHGLT
jgi:hypothetical protein